MIKSIDDFNFKGKNVLIRVDFNVPIDENKKITDDNRILESLPTIKKILGDGGKAILCSHLGRPDGKINLKYSLEPVANYLNESGLKTHFSHECIGEIAKKTIESADFGEIVLLENTRFHKEEEENDSAFSKSLAELADVYVNDAFGSAHRAHASTEGVTKFFENKFCGYLIYKEIKFLGDATKNPIRPFTAIIGGAKISGKIDVIKHLDGKCDYILVGGGMSYTFFKSMGYEIGQSLIEEDKLEIAKEILEQFENSTTKLILPIDIIVADSFSNDAAWWVTNFKEIPHIAMGLDIGPKTIELYKKLIEGSKTVLWNGPMGVFEFEKFSNGTFGVALAMANATSLGATTIVGGGDSAAAISKAKLANRVTHVSTGGGASLEYLEGIELPGIKALEN